MIRIRYIVNNVDEAVKFYTSNLYFELLEQYGTAVAILEREGVQLIVSSPKASASRPMPDGTTPSPGGWARFQIVVDDIQSEVSRLKKRDVQFKHDIIESGERKQVLCLDPSGNIVELFQTA